MKRRNASKNISIGVILGVFSYIFSVIILGSIKPDYSHIRDLVSELGETGSPFNFILNISLVFSGLVLIGLGIELHKEISKNSTKHRIGYICLALFGLSVICGGLFPCDKGCTEPVTISGYLHAITGIPAMITAPLSFVLIGLQMEKNQQWKSLYPIIFWGGILSIPAMILSATVFPYYGLTGLGQRIAGSFQLLIPVFLSLRLYRVVYEHRYEKLKTFDSARNSLWQTSDAILLIMMILGGVAHVFFPISIQESRINLILKGLGAIFLISGIAVIVGTKKIFNKTNQPTKPEQPSTMLITNGIFEYSRHPLYLGLIISILGIGLTTNILWWALLAFPAVIMFQIILIIPEEAYLKQKFGDDYIDYLGRVRMWI